MAGSCLHALHYIVVICDCVALDCEILDWDFTLRIVVADQKHTQEKKITKKRVTYISVP